VVARVLVVVAAGDDVREPAAVRRQEPADRGGGGGPAVDTHGAALAEVQLHVHHDQRGRHDLEPRRAPSVIDAAFLALSASVDAGLALR
jgi:hypothetical protein